MTPPVLTRGGFNPLKQKNTPKANPRHKGTRQKQTDEILNNQSKVVHEYVVIFETKNSPKANHAKQTDERTHESLNNKSKVVHKYLFKIAHKNLFEIL